jgi:hypothetical protein
MKNLVSVIIPTYNRRQLVAEAVESVLAQTYRPLEVIVIDDGSTDGTEEALRRFGDQIRHLTQANAGVAAARNLGIGAATGDYIALLDADDLWAPTKIAKQVEVLERSPKAGVVYCGVWSVNVQTGEQFKSRCDPTVRGDIRRKLLLRNRVTTSSLLIRRACFETVGRFDQTLRGSEDRDLWIRISRHFHYECVPEPLVTYRIFGDNLSAKIRMMHDCQMEVVRRAFRDDPVDGGNFLLRRRSLAHVHFDTGEEYLQAQAYGPALAHLLQAIRLWPLERRHYIFLARVLLRRPVIVPVSPQPLQQPLAGPLAPTNTSREVAARVVVQVRQEDLAGLDGAARLAVPGDPHVMGGSEDGSGS